VSRVLNAGLASLAWQTVAWSGGHVDPRIHLKQRIGSVFVGSPAVECDVNEQLQTYFGQSPASSPAPATTHEDDDMWKFLVDSGTVQSDGSYTRCAELLPTAELIGTSWADINAKLTEARAGGAPASVRGVDTSVFDDYEANSNAHKAATVNLAKLAGVGGPVTVTPGAYVINATVTPKEA
jgi:hypothetical protein